MKVLPGRDVQAGSFVYFVVAIGIALGLIITAFGPWRLGMVCFGGALGLAALARLTIPDRAVGLLGIRRRVIDVLMLVAMAALIVVLAIAIPSQPPL